MSSRFIDHLKEANIADGLLRVMIEFDLVEEYQNICEIQPSDNDRVRRKDSGLPLDRFFRCISLLNSYLLVIIQVSRLILAALCINLMGISFY